MLALEPPPKTYELGVPWLATHGGMFLVTGELDGTFLVSVGVFGLSAHVSAESSLALVAAFEGALALLGTRLYSRR